MDLPAEMGPASYVIDESLNPKLKGAVPVTFRVWCETKAPIVGGREIWGFPKYPKPVYIDLTYPDGSMHFSATNDGEPVIRMQCKKPGGDAIPFDARVERMYTVGGWTAQHDGVPKPTEYATNSKGTSYAAPWDPATDTLEVFDGKDWWLGAWLHKWSFAPVMKAWVPDFKIVAHRPNGWQPASEPHDYWPVADPKAEAALKAAGGRGGPPSDIPISTAARRL